MKTFLLILLILCFARTQIVDILNVDSHKISDQINHRVQQDHDSVFTDAKWLADWKIHHSDEPYLLVIDLHWHNDTTLLPADQYEALMTIQPDPYYVHLGSNVTSYATGIVPSKSIMVEYWEFIFNYIPASFHSAWNVFMVATDTAFPDGPNGESNCQAAVDSLKFDWAMGTCATGQYSGCEWYESAENSKSFGWDEAYHPGHVISLINAVQQSPLGKRCLKSPYIETDGWLCYKNIVDANGKSHARFCVRHTGYMDKTLHWWDNEGATYLQKEYEFRHQAYPVYQKNANGVVQNDSQGNPLVEKWRWTHLEKYNTYRVALNMTYEGLGDGTDEGWRKDASHRPWFAFPSMCHFVPPEEISEGDRPCIAEAHAAETVFQYLDDTDFDEWFREIGNAAWATQGGEDKLIPGSGPIGQKVYHHMDANKADYIDKLKKCMRKNEGEVYEEVSFCYTASFIKARQQLNYNEPGTFEVAMTNYMKLYAKYGLLEQMEDEYKTNYVDSDGNKPM